MQSIPPPPPTPLPRGGRGARCPGLSFRLGRGILEMGRRRRPSPPTSHSARCAHRVAFAAIAPKMPELGTLVAIDGTRYHAFCGPGNALVSEEPWPDADGRFIPGEQPPLRPPRPLP